MSLESARATGARRRRFWFSPWSPLLWVVVLFTIAAPIAVGAGFAALSLPVGTARLARRPGWDWLSTPARISARVNGWLPEFAVLSTGILLAVIAFVLAVFVWTVRYRDPWAGGLTLVAAGLSTLSTVIAAWLFAIVRGVSTTVYSWFDWIPWYVVVGLGVIMTIGWFVARVRDDGWSDAVGFLMFIVLGLAMFAGFGLLVLWLAGFWWIRLLFVLGLLGDLGRLVIDQFVSTVQVGRGLLGLLMGGIAVGTSLSMLLMISGEWGGHALYPRIVRGWIENWLKSNDPPRFDALVCLVVIGLCSVMVIANLFGDPKELSVFRFARSLTYTFWGMIFSGLLAAVGHRTETDDERH